MRRAIVWPVVRSSVVMASQRQAVIVRRRVIDWVVVRSAILMAQSVKG